jgi:hypothetical protein
MASRCPSGARLAPVVLFLASCGGGAPGAAPPSAPPAEPVPVVLSEVLPPAADVAGGVTVNVLGSGVLAGPGPVYVHFGSRAAVATVAADDLLRVVVPPGDAPAAVDVRVVTPHGFASLGQGFSYLPSPPPPPVLTCQPRVGSFSAATGGTRIDLEVAHFPPLTAPGVTIGGLAATNVLLLDATHVRVEVPSGLPVGQAAAVVLAEGPRVVQTSDFYVQGDVAPGDVAINEFLPEPGTDDANRDGTVNGAGDEFVELFNSRGVALDLTGWTLSDATSVRHTFPNPTSVPAGGSIVVFGSGNPTYFAPRHASGSAQVAATGTLGLNNSAESIVLRDPAGTVVAQTSYAAADVSAGRSRTADPDGQTLPVPASSGAYVFHDQATGALGTLSPGVKVTGAAFP